MGANAVPVNLYEYPEKRHAKSPTGVLANPNSEEWPFLALGGLWGREIKKLLLRNGFAQLYELRNCVIVHMILP